MGVYIYTLRVKSIMVENIRIHQSEYLCRANDLYEEGFGNETKRSRLLNLNIQRTKNRWNGTVVPKYSVIGSFNIGSPVYYNFLGIQVIWNDCDEFAGEVVGYLNKAGRKWVIQSDKEVKVIEKRAFNGAVDFGMITITDKCVIYDNWYRNFIKSRLGYEYLNFENEFIIEIMSFRNRSLMMK